MNFIQTDIAGVYIIEPKVFTDNRGYFFEAYNKQAFEDAGLKYDFIQDNQSKSTYGTIRGLHMQKGEFSQAKLVRVFSGTVLDVAVDVRKDSPTFGKHIAVELSGDNNRMLMIPRGFLHGFAVLSDEAIFTYKCDNVYNKASEYGMRYNGLDIDWRIPTEKAILSEKDAVAPLWDEFVKGL